MYILLKPLFLKVLCLVLACQAKEQPEEPLFTSDDKLTILDVSNFKSNVINSKQAWFINFYNSWCGHCIRFAPDWKAFGASVFNWRKFLSIGVVDCSSEKNTDLCRQYRVDGYPTLKLFPPDATENVLGELHEDGLGHDAMFEKSIKFLKEKGPPQVQELLTPVRSIEELQSSSRKKLIALMFDKELSILANAVVLDCSIFPSVIARKASAELGQKYGIKNVPGLYYVDRKGKLQHIQSGPARNAYSSALYDLLGKQASEDEKDNVEESLDSTKLPNITAAHQSNILFMEDLESTLRYAVIQDIGTCPVMSGDKITALKNFVTAIVELFPRNRQLHKNFRMVKVWLDEKTEVSGEEWSKKVKDIFGNMTLNWVGCQGSSARYRGYPCGLWQLFHTLTVQAYLKGSETETDFMRVLRVMHGYITNFFGCKECGENFKKETSGMEFKVFSLKDAILYLWRVHNSVNRRLKSDITEDPEHPKIQFPEHNQCVNCGQPENWSEDNVFRFLLNMYGTVWYHKPPNSTSQPSESELNFEDHSSDSTSNFFSNINSIDISLCLLLYALICAVIVALYYHFLVRKRYKFCSSFTSKV